MSRFRMKHNCLTKIVNENVITGLARCDASPPPSLSCLLLTSKELHLSHKIKIKVALAYQQLHFHFSHPANYFKTK